MDLSLIVAASQNRVIGRDGDLPWHLPADLKRFKRLTTGHSIIMGRKTFESIGRPLPKRRSIVLSQTPGFQPVGVEVAASLGEALELTQNEDEVFVIGGARVFAEALSIATRLYLTRVHADIEGDVFFPAIEANAWQLTLDQRHEADGRHAYPFSFLNYRSLQSAPVP